MYLVLSDIHGNVSALKKVLEMFRNQNLDGIIISGDILYSTSYFSGKLSKRDFQIIELLNNYPCPVVACMGNNDFEEDMQYFNFEVFSEYGVLDVYGKKILLTHGHLYYENQLPHIGSGDICISGHTHIPRAEISFGIYMLNPGSLSYPRGGYIPSYGIMNPNSFAVYSFNQEKIKEVFFNEYKRSK